MKYKKWNQAAPDRSAVLALMAAGLPALAATVLCARGVDTPEAAAAFLAAADAPSTTPCSCGIWTGPWSGWNGRWLEMNT